MRGGALFSLAWSGALALWTAVGCVGPSALSHARLPTQVTVLGKSSTPGTAGMSAGPDRAAKLSEILRSHNARQAALVRANVEHLAAIDVGGAPCAWKAIVVRTLPIPFRVRPGEPPFVRFSSGVLAVKFEQGAPTAANVMSDGGGVVLHAVADVHDLGFYPAHALTLSGFVLLHASARLSVSRAENAQLDVTYRLSDGVGPTIVPASVSARVPCSAVALVEQREVIDERMYQRCSTRTVLLKSPSVPLATTPGGRVVARLAAQVDAAIDILERRAGQVRIEIPRADDTIFGWVPSRAVTQDGLGYLSCHGRGQIDDHYWPAIDETSRCSIDIPLAVEQGQKRSPVGLIRAGTSFKIVARHPHSVSIEFYRDAGLQIVRGATFVIDPSSLALCRVRTPPRSPSQRQPRVGPLAATPSDTAKL